EDVKRLQKLVNDRLDSEKHDGLLPLVEQLLELQPERSSVKRLHKKAVKWKEEAEFRKLIGRIENLSGKGMFSDALLLVDDYLQKHPNSDEMREVRDGLKDKQQEKEGELAERVWDLIEKEMFDTALSLADDYLKRNPCSLGIRAARDAIKQKEKENLKEKQQEKAREQKERSLFEKSLFMTICGKKWEVNSR
ncbi:hypothetical protein N9002_00660, partial [bacterium]|nr:hypothetical protein [bacterium]